MKRLAKALPLLTLLLAGSAQASTIVYSNIGATPDSSSPDTLDAQGPQLGDSFSVSSPFEFTELQLLLQAAPSTDVNTPLHDHKNFSVDLYSGGNATSFGPSHQNLGIIGDDSLGVLPAPTDLTFSISLAAGQYWIVLTDIDGSTAGWAFSGDTSGTGVLNENYFAAGSFSKNTDPLGPHQMAVLGNLRASGGSSVPEPLTLSLFGAGLVGAASLRRRKKA